MAVGYAAEAIELAPDKPAVRQRLGQSLIAAGDPDGGRDAFRAVLAADPKDVDTHQMLAKSLADDGDWAAAADQAMEAYRNAIEGARPRRGFRYQMAVWAAKAAVGPAAARYRNLALIAELKSWKAATDPGAAAAFAAARAEWRAEPAFAPFRSAAVTAADRAKWAAFWDEVAAFDAPRP